jgi:elongation factor G
MAGGNTGGGGSVSAPTSPADIRNVVLVGPSGSGKTTLLEAMLAATGTIARAGRTTEGTTVSDFDEAEIRQQRSVGLALAPVVVGGVKVNFLDTPGYADFVGDLRAGLRAADAALFVVSAVDGVDGATQMVWEECAAVGMPRAVVVTRLDHQRADFDELVAICQRVFGEGVMPLMLPVLADDGTPAGFIDLITERIHDYSSGARVDRDPEPEHRDLIESTRASLIEGIIQESDDETLMDRYLAGEHIDVDTLITDLEKAVARGSFYPVLGTAVELAGLGTAEVLDLVRRAFPSPLEHPLPPVSTPDGDPRGPLACDPEGPLCAEVVKTTSDPYVGRLSLVRMFSGTLTPDTVVHVSGHFAPERGHEDHDVDERIGALSSPLGKTQRTIDRGIAGDIVAVAKLTRAETGDTLSDKDNPLLMESWVMPDALLPVAIVAKSKADEDKLGQALSRLVAEDATMRLQRNAETGQLVLWCMGEAHVDVLLDRLANRYGVAVESEELRVSLRETFATPAKARGRHVKQSGGHGQYAICDIEVTPLPAGSGFEFVDKVVGGAVPRQFIPSVEKGVRAQMEKGVAAGYPVVDVQVTLYDGKAHSVDSSDMAFQMAGSLALKEAAAAAQIAMLEPVSSISVLVADEFVGAVMGDLSSRRGRVAGSEPAGNGRTLIRAEVPELELTRYAIELRSMSHGTGTFTREYIGHEPMPPQIARKVIEASRDRG